MTAIDENCAVRATDDRAGHVRHDVVEPIVALLDLGASMLEIGRGPGIAGRSIGRPDADRVSPR